MAGAKNKKSKQEGESPSKAPEDTSNSSAAGSTKISADAVVIQQLKDLYNDRLLPIENEYLFSKFHSPQILDAEMSAKPTVLLIGQYSTGKTSFIRNLIGMDYPEIHIGPEPTTDRFVAVVHGEQAKTIKGNALTGVSSLPYAGLSAFGTGFLNKFAAAVAPADLLKTVNIVDTPGVLSGEKQRTSRGYDFAKVCRWFAERSDLILLMFDPSKLDISDEFKGVIEELRPHEDKVHCVLNKADSLDTEALIRVYGALLWSMGKVFRGAEVSRVYVGSFYEDAKVKDEHKKLFDKDRVVLMDRLMDLPKACGMRKVNEMVKRIRLATVNVCVLGHLRSQMPYLWGKDAAQDRLIKNLPQIFDAVRGKYSLAEGDFPNVDEFRAVLQRSNFYSFPRYNTRDSHVFN
jgi:EH domain-containing protein 1